MPKNSHTMEYHTFQNSCEDDEEYDNAEEADENFLAMSPPATRFELKQRRVRRVRVTMTDCDLNERMFCNDSVMLPSAEFNTNDSGEVLPATITSLNLKLSMPCDIDCERSVSWEQALPNVDHPPNYLRNKRKAAERLRKEERDNKLLDMDIDAAAHMANLGGTERTSPLLLERKTGAIFEEIIDPATLLDKWEVKPTTASNTNIDMLPGMRVNAMSMVAALDSICGGVGSGVSAQVLYKSVMPEPWSYVSSNDAASHEKFENMSPSSCMTDFAGNGSRSASQWTSRVCPPERVNSYERICKMLDSVLPSKFNKRVMMMDGYRRTKLPTQSKERLSEKQWEDLRSKLMEVSLSEFHHVISQARSKECFDVKEALLSFTVDTTSTSNNVNSAWDHQLSQDYVINLSMARNQVSAILERVDRYHDLFCSSKHLERFDPSWRVTHELDKRVRCLRLWFNQLGSLCSVLATIEKELRLEPGALQPLPPVLVNDEGEWPRLRRFVHDHPIADQSCSAAADVAAAAAATLQDFNFTALLEQQQQYDDDAGPTPTLNEHDFIRRVYRDYIDRQLRNNKLRMVLQRLHNLVHSTLVACQLTLRLRCEATQHRNCSSPSTSSAATATMLPTFNVQSCSSSNLMSPQLMSPSIGLQLPVHDDDVKVEPLTVLAMKLDEFGGDFSQLEVMALPSLFPIFVKVLRVLLDVMYECMDMQCCTRGDRYGRRLEPLSLMCNIVEFREVLKYAIVVRCYFTEMLKGVLGVECNSQAKEALERVTANKEMDDYDSAVIRTMDLFFHDVGEYLELFTKLVEPQRDQALLLENEWHNIKSLLEFFPDGQRDAIKRFCMLTTRVMYSLRDFLDCTNEIVRDKFSDDSWQNCDRGYDDDDDDDDCANDDDDDDVDDDVAVRAVEPVLEHGSELHADYTNSNSSLTSPIRKFNTQVSIMSQSLKATFNTARDGMMQAIGVARLLHRELELLTEFSLAPNATRAQLFDVLRKAHVLLRLQSPSNRTLACFAPLQLAHQLDLVRNLLQPTFARVSPPRASYNKIQSHYLLLLSMESVASVSGDCECEHEAAERLWSGGLIVDLELNAENHIALSHLEVAPGGLLLLAQNCSELEQQRELFAQSLTLGSDCACAVATRLLLVVKEKCCGHAEIAEKLREIKEAAIALAACLHDNINKSVEKAALVQEFAQADTATETYRKTLYKCFSVAFDYHRELCRLFPDYESQKCLAEFVRKFALLWLDFLKNWCPRGTGMVPRWCEPGLLFLIDLALHPQYAEFYSTCDYHELLDCYNESICGVVGTPLPKQICLSNEVFTPTTAAAKQRLSHSTSSEQNHLSLPFNVDEVSISREKRIAKKLRELEAHCEKRLIAQRLGRVIDTPQKGQVCIKDVPRVSFNWTRIQMLGTGSYGRVFLVKTNDQRMMAMKVMPRNHLDQDSSSSMYQLAEETKLFTSLKHDNVVRYYGVQVHRHDMSIFMEFCKGGTLQSAARSGLDSMLIRQYTREVLQALCFLHEQHIVHRDVKPANVFLTGNQTSPLLKLGDFGSFTRLQVGSLSRLSRINNGLVGTERYMAPEIIREETPVRCASDIWSAGCLVWQLFNGKAPWGCFTCGFQVVATVGEFCKEEHAAFIRKSLPDESSTGPYAHEFMRLCLRVKAEERPSAAELLKHSFCQVLNYGETVNA